MARTYLARWPSRCARCLERIPKGEQIATLTGSGAVHARCHPELDAPRRPAPVARSARQVDGPAAAVDALHKEIQARDLGRR
jgi:hypothetical protein